MFPVIREFFIILPLIDKNLSIFPHVPHILILGFGQIIIENKIFLCIFVQEHFLTAAVDKVFFHIELFQVFGSEVSFTDAFVQNFIVIVKNGFLNEVVAEPGLGIIINLIIKLSRITLSEFLIKSLFNCK